GQCIHPPSEAGATCQPTGCTATGACQDDGNPCTQDVCNGAGGCIHRPGNAGILCRPADQCTSPATCDGKSANCPANPPAREGLSCEASGCDPRRSICRGGSCVCLPLPLPGCGDGMVATGEECGEPGLPDGPCCVGCRFAGAGTICRPAVNAC